MLTTATALASFVALLAAAPPGARDFTVAPEGSSLSYKLVHKLHTVEGTAKGAQGSARVLADGTVQVVARAEVARFDSGNGNRDSHMQEVTEAAKFPQVEFKGVGKGFTFPAQTPAKVSLPVAGRLTFHGQQQAVALTVEVTAESEGKLTVDASFPISLEAFKVERPSLMFVAVEDKVEIVLHLVLEAVRPEAAK